MSRLYLNYDYPRRCFMSCRVLRHRRAVLLAVGLISSSAGLALLSSNPRRCCHRCRLLLLFDFAYIYTKNA